MSYKFDVDGVITIYQDTDRVVPETNVELLGTGGPSDILIRFKVLRYPENSEEYFIDTCYGPEDAVRLGYWVIKSVHTIFVRASTSGRLVVLCCADCGWEQRMGFRPTVVQLERAQKAHVGSN